MISILIVDDQKVIREQLKSYFEPEPDLQVVGIAIDSIEALEQIKKLKPQIVLMDIEMPGGVSGLEMTSMISNLFPEIKVIILTGHFTEEYGQKAVQVGAGAYLPKSIPANQLIDAIRKVESTQGDSALLRQTREVSNMIDYSTPELATISSAATPDLFAQEASPFYYLDEEVPEQSHSSRFLGLGILFNSVIWLMAIAYLKLTPAAYTSQWGVKILETDAGVEVVLPDGGKAAPAAGGWTPPTGQDPRNDYVFVATSPDLLAEAAAKADMTLEEYQEPSIKVDEENGIIAFEIVGNSPEEARSKALIFHQTMTEQIEDLREAELSRQEEETQGTLAEARTKLTVAQDKLSQYRAQSGISTDEQIKNLTDNIETLRSKKAELAAQQEGLANRYGQLNRDINNLKVAGTDDAYRLAGDSVYQEYKSRYAQLQGVLTGLKDRYTSSHPIVKTKQAELNNTASAMKQRASQVLGKSISLTTLTRIDGLTLDPQNVLAREGLQQDLVNNRAEWQRLKAENQELTAQIDTLESRLRNMSQEQFEVDSLKRDLQVAETVFAATLAKLDLGQENIYSIYPPLQLVTPPNLAEKPSNPQPGSVFMGGLAGSFLVTTGLGLLWFDRKKFGNQTSITSQATNTSSSFVTTI